MTRKRKEKKTKKEWWKKSRQIIKKKLSVCLDTEKVSYLHAIYSGLYQILMAHAKEVNVTQK